MYSYLSVRVGVLSRFLKQYWFWFKNRCLLSEIDKIRVKRQNVILNKMKYDSLVTLEQIIDFKTKTLFDKIY